jgi:hypothetical protein
MPGHRSIRSFINLGDTLYSPLELAAYTDDDPPHIMENGSPHARYAILEKTSAGWLAEQISVPYDWNKAAACARQKNREDWAHWLMTGRAQSNGF